MQQGPASLRSGQEQGEAVEHGTQPNAGEVRPGNAAGDAPSAAAGDLVTRQERRVLGLPVTTALVLAGVILALLVAAGIVIPGARRRDLARGGGTYGRPEHPTRPASRLSGFPRRRHPAGRAPP